MHYALLCNSEFKKNYKEAQSTSKYERCGVASLSCAKPWSICPIYWMVEWLAPATDATDTGAEDADGDRPDELIDSNNNRTTDLEKAGETRASVVPDTDVDVDVNKAEDEWKHDGTRLATDEEEPQVIEPPKEESSQTRDTSSVYEDLPAEDDSSVDDDPPAEGETAKISQKITNARQRASPTEVPHMV
jgi:hypothetical protein